MSPAEQSLDPYHAIVLVSFGGPEGPDDVLPFLRNVTAGRGIPADRLAQVAEHYQHFGGRSPINDQNRALLAALRAELDARGQHIRLAWGNRNWAPFLADTLRGLHEAGARRVLALTTSAYSSYSGCRQYRENLADAQLVLADEGRELDVDKVRPYYNHPGFVAPNVRAASVALAALPEGAHLAFVTHSVPVDVDETSGPDGGAYRAQHRELATLVAGAVQRQVGRHVPWELVFCSRSGPPTQRWLEPDVGEHLRALASRGVPGVAVCPIGFVSDHLEVVYDLDTEARAVAECLALPFVRAATVGVDPVFVAGLVDLLFERAAQARGQEPATPALGRLGAAASSCPAGCCPNLREPTRLAAAGRDWAGVATVRP